MKKSLLLTCIFIISSYSSNLIAQSVYSDTDIEKYISNTPVPKVTDATYVGSPYIDDNFKKGVISKNEIIISHNVGLRYNANKDYFEIKKTFALNDDQAKLMKKSNEITISINNNKYVYFPRSEVNTVSGYFNLLLKDENISLYKKTKMTFIAGQKAYNSMVSDVAPTYKENVTYYITRGDKQLIPLSNSKKGKLKEFDDHKKEVKLYIKENKININKDDSFIKLVKYYNTL